ncbi:MAG TPA: hypothetical protein VNU72_06370, partial [Puia sp.]|nr:hypothetical protein [Puia sp.]
LTKGFRSGFDGIYSYPNVLFLIVSLLGFALSTVVCLFLGKPVNILVIIMTVLTLLVGMRNAYSNNGSDQLANIILVCLAIAMLQPGSTLIRTLSVVFIVFQIELSYITSGVYKLIGPGWRNGSSLKGVLSTGQFGNAHLKRWMDSNPVTYILMSFGIIFGEILLGLSFLLPPELCLFMLSVGVLFHLSVAVIMGFNTFVWTFLAAYPAVYYASLELNAMHTAR